MLLLSTYQYAKVLMLVQSPGSVIYLGIHPNLQTRCFRRYFWSYFSERCIL